MYVDQATNLISQRIKSPPSKQTKQTSSSSSFSSRRSNTAFLPWSSFTLTSRSFSFIVHCRGLGQKSRAPYSLLVRADLGGQYDDNFADVDKVLLICLWLVMHTHIYSCYCVFNIYSIFMPTKSPLIVFGSDCFTAFRLIIQTWINFIMLITVIRSIEYVTCSFACTSPVWVCARVCTSGGCAIHLCYISILNLLFHTFQLESSHNDQIIVWNITWHGACFHLIR